MELYTKKETCCGCGACADVCPTGAIHMKQDREGFLYPYIENGMCTKCGYCTQVCPLKNPLQGTHSHRYFGVQAIDAKIRSTSSSGGIFTVLAQYVFQRQGVVFGAAYGENMEVVHTEASDMKQLEKLKRTKYVQSNLIGIYSKIAELLAEDRWVLFCGTPCQGHALRLFLNRSYEKLIIADLICYGVPSPGVWNSYVKGLERRYGGKVTDFSFRDKRNRDNGHTCVFVAGGQERVTSLYSDRYCMMYFGDFILRPSCHECKFSTPDRDSDFTIGDFWGIEGIRPDMDDGMGTSAVILHTRNAREIWDQIRGDLNWFECKKEEILQPRLTGPTKAAPGRKLFMMLYQILPFSLFEKLAWGMTEIRSVLK